MAVLLRMGSGSWQVGCVSETSGRNQIRLAFLLDRLVKSQIKIRGKRLGWGGGGEGERGGEFNHIISCVSP